MAKSNRSDKAASGRGDGSSLTEFAEDLGRLLGTTERKATAWLGQRESVAKQLSAIRDQASALLAKLGAGRGEPATTRPSQGAGPKRGPGRPKGSTRKKRTMSPEARAKIAEAQRKRWARQKAQGK
jgi:hypothetical protein